MGEPTPESSEVIHYTEPFSVVKKDPFDYASVVCRAAQSLGYRISFEDGAKDNKGNVHHDYYSINAADKAEADKVGEVFSLTHAFNTSMLISEIGRGSPITPFMLMENDQVRRDTANYRLLLRTYPDKVQRPFDQRFLEEALMQAVSRNDLPAALNPKILKLNRELEEKGVRPLTPEAAMIVVATDIKDILAKHPELAPDNYQT